jgi:hypothetical protein
MRPASHFVAIYYVQNENQPPEEPDSSFEAIQIELSPVQFRWLTRQCEFLGVTKQALVVDALQEWICRNRSKQLRTNPTAIVYWALDDFMRRHRNEFLPVESQDRS